MAENGPVVVYTHREHPEWGRAVVLQEREGKLDLPFEDGHLRTFRKTEPKLDKVELADDERAALDAKLRGRARPKELHAKPGAKKSGKSAGGAQGVVYPSFRAQVAAFEGIFPGGFHGEAFTRDERGLVEAPAKKSYKAGAIKQAQEKLSAAAFGSTSVEELFAAAKQLMSFTNIVFPIEGSIPFSQLAAEARPAVIEALRDLLHGTGDYNARFDRFVSTLQLKDSKGQPKRPTWPTVTILPALFDPSKQVAVKPTAFMSQAKLVGVGLNFKSLPDGETYQQFMQVALATDKALRDAGLQPRDLMDVYSFIWTTHNAKPAPAKT